MPAQLMENKFAWITTVRAKEMARERERAKEKEKERVRVRVEGMNELILNMRCYYVICSLYFATKIFFVF